MHQNAFGGLARPGATGEAYSTSLTVLKSREDREGKEREEKGRRRTPNV